MIVPENDIVNPAEERADGNMDVEKAPLPPSGQCETKVAPAAAVSEAEGSSDSGSDLVSWTHHLLCISRFISFCKSMMMQMISLSSFLPNASSVPYGKQPRHHRINLASASRSRGRGRGLVPPSFPKRSFY